MTKEQQEIFNLQKFDSLQEAENIIGESYKTNDSVGALGMLLQFQKSNILRKKLEQIGDTCFSETVDLYISKVSKFGFKVVYKEPFKRFDKHDNIEIDECLYVLFNKHLGALIHFDSFTWGPNSTPGVNGGNVYYNWAPNDIRLRGGLTSSGSFLYNKEQDRVMLFNEDLETEYMIEGYPQSLRWDKISWEEFKEQSKPIEEQQRKMLDEALQNGKRPVWVGDHDCREGIMTKLQALVDNGVLLPKWQGCQLNWILNYTEYGESNKDWNAWKEQVVKITNERIAKMPQEVKDCINNTYKG